MKKLLAIIILCISYINVYADVAIYPRERTIRYYFPLIITIVLLVVFVIVPILFLLKKIRKDD